jgi:tetratricopeptide (TPR) repeat protein
VSPRGARAAAVALAVAALVPGRAWPDPLNDAEHGVAGVESLLASVDEAARRPDETSTDLAVRKFSNGETHYLLGDWPHAALLLGEALDDASFRAGPQGATATFYLGDSLRHAGSCGAARPYLKSYIQGSEPAHRGEALTAAIDCAVRLDHRDEVGPLLAEADRYYAGQLPPELRYLSAKVIFGRTDLSPEDRFRDADAAFAAVGTPYTQQSAYYQAVLRLERNDLAGAAERFAACAALAATDARQREAQDLCTLGLARVRTEMGDLPGAISAYSQMPIDSPFFDESLHEVATVHGRAGQLEPALRAAETLTELEPDSPLASRSMLLQGRILLRQGKYESANQVYQHVIDEYAPLRDQLDSVLTEQEDPVRYFADLLSRGGKPGEVASVLPPVALRAALDRPEMARAAGIMQDVYAGVKDWEENRTMWARISAVLQNGDGIDAIPRLRQGYAGVQAVENAVAVLQGAAASAAVEAASNALEPGPQSELAGVHAERLVLETRLNTLPRTADAARARLDRWTDRIDGLDRQSYQLGYLVDAARAAVTGVEVWLQSHRVETPAQRTQREELSAELREHREVLAGYEDELKKLRLEIAQSRDAASGAGALDEEAKLRSEYLSLLAEERKILDGARGRLSGTDKARLERAWAVADRLGEVGARARALADWIAGEARRRADGLRARLAAEQAALVQEQAALAAVQAEARGTVGGVAYRSFAKVREEFYRLVLRADVGLNDVVWTRKADRTERIQKLSMQMADELKAMERRYRPVLEEEQ